MVNEEQPEKVYLERGRVRVTDSRFQVNSRTYDLRGVNSVAYQRKEASTRAAGTLAVAGFLLLLGAAAFAIQRGLDSRSGVAFAVGAAAVVGGAFAALQGKPKYSVALNTPGGEIQALSSEDPTHVANVVVAMNEALLERK